MSDIEDEYSSGSSSLDQEAPPTSDSSDESDFDQPQEEPSEEPKLMTRFRRANAPVDATTDDITDETDGANDETDATTDDINGRSEEGFTTDATETPEATDSEMLSTSSIKSNSRWSTRPISTRSKGGLKVSKKTTTDPLYLQKLIDKDLRERIPISAFLQEKIVTMIKNTVGIKCKQCGSDNVYVESKQVRSADEAMTKFYTCLNCGNKWRFD